MFLWNLHYDFVDPFLCFCGSLSTLSMPYLGLFTGYYFICRRIFGGWFAVFRRRHRLQHRCDQRGGTVIADRLSSKLAFLEVGASPDVSIFLAMGTGAARSIWR